MGLAEFIKEIGGGLAGVVIAVQGWFTWTQSQRNSAPQGKMLAMAETSVKADAGNFVRTWKSARACRPAAPRRSPVKSG